MDDDEELEHARHLATPIDFDTLIREGVIERAGKHYRVLDFKRLPEPAAKRMRVVRPRKDGSLLVRFLKPSKTLAREYERLTGKRIPTEGGSGG